jgi:hypothetical protein
MEVTDTRSHLHIVTCLAEYRKDGTVVSKELGKGVPGVTFPTATNMEIPW